MSKRRYQSVTLEFYRAISGQPTARIEDIPADRLSFLLGMSYSEKVRPLIVRALKNDVPVWTIADTYGVSRTIVYRLKSKYVGATPA